MDASVLISTPTSPIQLKSIFTPIKMKSDNICEVVESSALNYFKPDSNLTQISNELNDKTSDIG